MVQSASSPREGTLISSRPTLREVFSDPVYCLALGLGSGLAPRAPGTVGTLAAVPFFLLLAQLPLLIYLGVVAVSFGAGVLICDRAAKRMGVKDPSAVVWDEFVGLWIALSMLPREWPYVVAGFLAFRFFDILKPWPVSVLDREIGGGLGIMADDAAAGIMALALVWAGSAGLVWLQ